jgi:hypothetical protein
MRDPVGKLRASWQLRERYSPHRSVQKYFVGTLYDDLGIVWTCEARTPSELHEHLSVPFAHDCAAQCLADGTWKDEVSVARAQ